MANYPPADYITRFERRWNIRRADYDMFVGSLHLRTRNPSYLPERYIESAMNDDFDIKAAIVKRKWNGENSDPSRVSEVRDFIQAIGLPVIEVDAFGDPNWVASTVRQYLYPRSS